MVDDSSEQACFILLPYKITRVFLTKGFKCVFAMQWLIPNGRKENVLVETVPLDLICRHCFVDGLVYLRSQTVHIYCESHSDSTSRLNIYSGLVQQIFYFPV